MDFIKLKELPKISAVVEENTDAQRFKLFRKRAEQSCGGETDVSAMCFCPSSESSQLAVACGSKVQVYDVGFSTATETDSWSKHKNIIHAIAYRRDGKLLIAADGDGSANIYDVAVTKNIIRRLRGHDGAIFATVFCGDATKVATAGQDQSVKIWDVPTGQVVLNLKGHTDSVRALLAVGENGLVSAGSDGKIIQWDIRGEGDALFTVSHGAPVEQLALFDSGAMFFSIGGGVCKLWDVRSMTQVKEAQAVKHTKPVTAAVVSARGDFIATSSFDTMVKITKISTWEVVASFSSPVAVTALAWMGDSLVYGSEKGSWVLRQRRAEIAAAPAIDTSEARYYTTTEIAAGNRGRESNPDFLLRKFEYRKLIDFILDTDATIALSMAIIDELIQRGGLLAALRDRSTEDIVRVVEWCTRNLTVDPRCSVQLVARVLDTVVEGNKRAFASPEAEAEKALVKAVRVLNGRVAQEMTLQYKASALAGVLESLVAGN